MDIRSLTNFVFNETAAKKKPSRGHIYAGTAASGLDITRAKRPGCALTLTSTNFTDAFRRRRQNQNNSPLTLPVNARPHFLSPGKQFRGAKKPGRCALH